MVQRPQQQRWQGQRSNGGSDNANVGSDGPSTEQRRRSDGAAAVQRRGSDGTVMAAATVQRPQQQCWQGRRSDGGRNVGSDGPATAQQQLSKWGQRRHSDVGRDGAVTGAGTFAVMAQQWQRHCNGDSNGAVMAAATFSENECKELVVSEKFGRRNIPLGLSVTNVKKMQDIFTDMLANR